jgi:hypothetical protein
MPSPAYLDYVEITINLEFELRLLNIIPEPIPGLCKD